jgi:NADH dehydrogenase FAD-containing subunit
MLKVDRDTLLVQDQSKVFAIGDIITPGLVESPFTSGYITQQEAPKLAKNLIAACSGKPLKPMGKPPSKRGGILSLGPNNGAGHFDNFVLPQCVVTMMKSKDLFRKKMIHAFQKA